jgi:hypothetical protein
MPIIFWESRGPSEPKPRPDRPEGTSPNSASKTKFTFQDYQNVFPDCMSPGLELAPLHRILNLNNPISKQTLFAALKRWADDGFITIIEDAGRPRRYRRK